MLISEYGGCVMDWKIILIAVSVASGDGTLLPNDTMNATRRKIVCTCEPPKCSGRDYCETVHSCYSAKSTDHPNFVTKGCTSSSLPLLCKMPPGPEMAIECCNTDFCNKDLQPALAPIVEADPDSSVVSNAVSGQLSLILAIVIPAACIIILIPAIVFICRHIHRKRMRALISREQRLLSDDIRATQVGESTLQELYDESCTSGSGSGLPFLVQRTVARQVTLQECIGKGRYGEVWRGHYHGENVAVKIFSSRDEASWARETEIYNTILLRHDSILGYLASDMTSRNSCTQLWLITQYQERGSLYDHLQFTELSRDAMLLLCHSAAAGLVHLHTEIMGSEGKLAIAHRDIKSKNILVKNNGTCCIGDLGLAVIHDAGHIDVGANHKVGTKRYMAPELLEDTLNPDGFEAFKCVDMYAFGLVLWEVARRCKIKGIAEEYHPPYWDVVPSDPDFEDMRKIVVVDQQRPSIPNRWCSDAVLQKMGRLMRECWHHNPRARLTMLRVKKTLSQIIRESTENKISTKSS